MSFNIMKFFNLFQSLKSQPDCSESFKRRRVQNSTQLNSLKNEKFMNGDTSGYESLEVDPFLKNMVHQSFCDHENKETLKINKSVHQIPCNTDFSHERFHISRKKIDMHKKSFSNVNQQKHHVNLPVRLPKVAVTGRQLFENALKRHDNIVYSKGTNALALMSFQKTSSFYNLQDPETSFMKNKYSPKFKNFNRSLDFQNNTPGLYDTKIFKNHRTQNISQNEELFSPLSSKSLYEQQKKDCLNSYCLKVPKKELESQNKTIYNFKKHQSINDSDSLDKLIKQLKEKYKNERFYNWNTLQKQKQERDHEIQKLKDLSIKSSYQLPPLSKELLKKVEDALSSNRLKDPLIVKFNISITSYDIRTLRDKEWLNDEIINFYIALISERAKASPEGPKVYAFNTFFYTTLEKKGYQGVQRWTKRAKVNIMQQDYVFIPIHLGIHWCMSVINFKKKRFEYWDSLNGSSGNTFYLLRDYLLQESGNTIDLNKWDDYIPESGPIQRNGYDCGVFACKTAECIAREVSVDYTQDDIKELRKRMVANIIEGRLF
ncbi:unnamed protein product [Pneumocystis jirovecii]|uniref:Ubiquitin-like protease family profile domain-containing protein n=1 Tax=Pneumocystis jirovecii TaxID=42068 RepID=L0PDV6_PNEJI|nr:unnamed protein product [Pneumocystis jirovecii]